MKTTDFKLRSTVVMGGIMLLGMPWAFAQTAQTPPPVVHNVIKDIKSDTQDIKSDKSVIVTDNAIVKADRATLASAIASGNAAAITAAKKQLAQDVLADKVERHDLRKDDANRHEDVGALKDVKDIKQDKEQITDDEAHLKQARAHVTADISALKAAEASGNAAAIAAAKAQLANDHKVAVAARSALRHAHRDLRHDKRDLRQDRREIKHGK